MPYWSSPVLIIKLYLMLASDFGAFHAAHSMLSQKVDYRPQQNRCESSESLKLSDFEQGLWDQHGCGELFSSLAQTNLRTTKNSDKLIDWREIKNQLAQRIASRDNRAVMCYVPISKLIDIIITCDEAANKIHEEIRRKKRNALRNMLIGIAQEDNPKKSGLKIVADIMNNFFMMPKSQTEELYRDAPDNAEDLRKYIVKLIASVDQIVK